jgi:hypothetical protein
MLPSLAVFAPPSVPGSGPVAGRERMLRITGHFDDPAAASCRVSNYPTPVDLYTSDSSRPLSVDTAHAVAECRERFVATSIVVIGP